MSEKRYLSTGQVARMLGVTPRYVRARCDQGEIPGAFKLPGSTHWRVPRDWVQSVVDAAKPRKREAQ
jgi:excisionase family DNA binding protein